MATEILHNELLIGEEGTGRKALVPCTVEQAILVLRWFKGLASDAELIEMLANHDILHCHPTARFTKCWPGNRGTPWIEMRIPAMSRKAGMSPKTQ